MSQSVVWPRQMRPEPFLSSVISLLVDLFPGPLRSYGEAVVLAGPIAPGTAHLPVAGLGTPAIDAALDAALHVMARHYGKSGNDRVTDRRVVASVWARHYFSALLPAPLAALALRHHGLPLDRAICVVDPRGIPTQLQVPHPGETQCHASASARFGGLLEHHLHPLIEALSRVSGVSVRLLWANAGAVTAEVFRHAPALLQPGMPATRATLEADAAWLMDTRIRADGSANPLHAPMRAHSVTRDGVTSTLWLRRMCCLRYRLPGFDLCGDCPRQLRR